eukprot:6479138-Amphidinium_carterae.6
MRARSKCSSTPRATTPQPRMKVHPVALQVQAIVEDATIDDYELIADDLIAEADPYIYNYNNHGQEAANEEFVVNDNKANLTRLLQFMRQVL